MYKHCFGHFDSLMKFLVHVAWYCTYRHICYNSIVMDFESYPVEREIFHYLPTHTSQIFLKSFSYDDQ